MPTLLACFTNKFQLQRTIIDRTHKHRICSRKVRFFRWKSYIMHIIIRNYCLFVKFVFAKKQRSLFTPCFRRQTTSTVYCTCLSARPLVRPFVIIVAAECPSPLLACRRYKRRILTMELAQKFFYIDYSLSGSYLSRSSFDRCWLDFFIQITSSTSMFYLC